MDFEYNMSKWYNVDQANFWCYSNKLLWLMQFRLKIMFSMQFCSFEYACFFYVKFKHPVLHMHFKFKISKVLYVC